MKRVAIVVQRCHESVVGGSESLALQYARLLSGQFAVEILSSTATDYVRWENVLPAGTGEVAGIPVRRFPVAMPRTPYWHDLHRRMLDEPESIRSGNWRAALQEEFIRFQGPWCPGLEHWLREHGADYAAVLFCTYLYPTTYFAIRCLPPEKTLLVPTLHDEPPAYLPVFAARYARHPGRIWLTAAEQRTARRLWGFDEGEVLGMAVEQTGAARPEERSQPYLLYCGRIDESKGCAMLLRAFARLPSRGRVRLVLTGADHMGLEPSPDIDYLGFVDEERKFALMAGALGFVMPSPFESFSIVLLEAMAQGAPVIANAACEVLRDHVDLSAGGYHYASEDEMVAAMERVCMLDPSERARLGSAGRAYVLERYGEDRVRERLVACVERIAARNDAGAS